MQNSLSLGTLNYAVQSLVFGLSSKMRVHYIMGATMIMNPLRLNVLTAAMAQHAPNIRLSQGQVRGAVTNLGSIVAIVANLIWPRVYAIGVKAGNPGLFYLPIAAVAAAQLLVVRLEMTATRTTAHTKPNKETAP